MYYQRDNVWKRRRTWQPAIALVGHYQQSTGPITSLSIYTVLPSRIQQLIPTADPVAPTADLVSHAPHDMTPGPHVSPIPPRLNRALKVAPNETVQKCHSQT